MTAKLVGMEKIVVDLADFFHLEKDAKTVVIVQTMHNVHVLMELAFVALDTWEKHVMKLAKPDTMEMIVVINANVSVLLLFF